MSGPGSLSKRTDGKQPIRVPTGGAYGSGVALQGIEQGAAMAQTPGVSPAPRQRAPSAARTPVPFGAPTQRPDEPVTAGAALGPGPGPEALGLQSPNAAAYQSSLSVLQAAAASGGSPEVQALLGNMQGRN